MFHLINENTVLLINYNLLKNIIANQSNENYKAGLKRKRKNKVSL